MKQTFSFILALLLSVSVANAAEVIKILAIGNSFSEDAIEQNFRDICVSQGHQVIVGNLYIGGCPIEKHYVNAKENAAAYRYRHIAANGKMITYNKCTLRQALLNEHWDYISFQQASHDSGLYSTFDDLPALMEYVRKIVGPKPKFIWHMTWAYADNSTHSGFANYGNDRLSMYAAITSTARRIMIENPELKILIPSGTAVENGRLLIDDGASQLTRDGFHMNKVYGRYLVACTWYCAIFRRIIDAQTVFFPKGVTEEMKLSCLYAATDAVISPFAPIEDERNPRLAPRGDIKAHRSLTASLP